MSYGARIVDAEGVEDVCEIEVFVKGGPRVLEGDVADVFGGLVVAVFDVEEGDAVGD